MKESWAYCLPFDRYLSSGLFSPVAGDFFCLQRASVGAEWRECTGAGQVEAGTQHAWRPHPATRGGPRGSAVTSEI